MISSGQWQRWRWLVLGGALALLSILLLRYKERVFLPPPHDFLQYWAAARLNLAGENPFVAERVLALWIMTGWSETWVLVMYNPPWVLSLMIPWALLDAGAAWLFWQLCLWFCVVGSIYVLWDSYDGPIRLRWVGWVVGLVFAPAIISIRSGQLGAFVLVGASLFLWGCCHPTRAALGEWVAALAVLLISVKPHVLYLFWMAWLMWIVIYRRWSLLGKTTVCGLAALLIAMLTNPPVLIQYLIAVIQRPPDIWVTSAWGSLLRLAFGPEKFWLQFVPSLLAAAVYAAYSWRRRREWDWAHELPALILWAQITRPYGWTHDLIVTLLPLIAVIAQAGQRGAFALRIALGGYIAMQIVLVLGHRFVPPGDHQLVWLPLVVGGYYLVTKRAMLPMAGGESG